jgi:type III secretory pathway lipoprotein EscJ
VLDARVHLAVPVKGPLGDDDAPPPTASVLIRHRGATPPLSSADIQRLVSGAVAGLSEKNVSVVMTSAPEPPHPGERDLARFGPITVTRSSMTPLRLLIGAAALLNVVLIGLLVALWARIRRTQNELSETRLSAEAAARDAR